jgi:hypothetical protein
MADLLRPGNRQLPCHLAQGFSGSDLTGVYRPRAKSRSRVVSNCWTHNRAFPSRHSRCAEAGSRGGTAPQSTRGKLKIRAKRGHKPKSGQDGVQSKADLCGRQSASAM